MKIDNRKAIVSIFVFLCNCAALALDYSKTLDNYIEEDLSFAKYVTMHGSPSSGSKIWLVPCPRCFKQK